MLCFVSRPALSRDGGKRLSSRLHPDLHLRLHAASGNGCMSARCASVCQGYASCSVYRQRCFMARHPTTSFRSHTLRFVRRQISLLPKLFPVFSRDDAAFVLCSSQRRGPRRPSCRATESSATHTPPSPSMVVCPATRFSRAESQRSITPSPRRHLHD
ncbi:hypothetical protein LZ30DRAFT_31877 [Colletotrichum cereale]|nr:hypothetical protein LZ30DRAFT_31877 [Colletotrichum cereale]